MPRTVIPCGAFPFFGNYTKNRYLIFRIFVQFPRPNIGFLYSYKILLYIKKNRRSKKDFVGGGRRCAASRAIIGMKGKQYAAARYPGARDHRNAASGGDQNARSLVFMVSVAVTIFRNAGGLRPHPVIRIDRPRPRPALARVGQDEVASALRWE